MTCIHRITVEKWCVGRSRGNSGGLTTAFIMPRRHGGMPMNDDEACDNATCLICGGEAPLDWGAARWQPDEALVTNSSLRGGDQCTTQYDPV